MAKEILRRVDMYGGRVLVGTNFGFHGHELVTDLVTFEDALAFAAVDVPGYRKILALDEVQMMADARKSVAFPPAAQIVFTQGRKLGLSLLYTTQNWRFVDVTIRRVTNEIRQCTGLFPVKQLDDEGFLVGSRPRLIRVRSFYDPPAESDSLPERASSVSFHPFPWDVASSYDTNRLVASARSMMKSQYMRTTRMQEALLAIMEAWGGGPAEAEGDGLEGLS